MTSRKPWQRTGPDKRIRGREGQRLRKRRLARTAGLCEMCEAEGLVTAATVVNHKLPLAHGGLDVDENTENAKFFLNRSSLGAVRKLKDGQGNYIWQPTYVAGQPSTLLGRPVVDVPDMPNVAAGTFDNYAAAGLIAEPASETSAPAEPDA